MQEQNYLFLTTVKLFFLSLAGFVSGILIYLNINAEFFAIFTALIVIDFITGVWAAHTLGKSITSNRAKYGLISKFSLLIVPIALALAAKVLGKDASLLFDWGLGLLIFSEAYSTISNITAIRTGKDLPEWDALALLGKKIRSLFERGNGNV